MKRFVAIALVLASACKGDETTPAAKPAAAPANDPWAKKQTTAADVKDKDLARLIELAQNGPGKDKFPQADAVIALERDDITLLPDGTVVTKHHSIVKLLDPQRGKDKYADLHIPFDGRRETLVIERARTVNDDGKEHAVGAEEIADIVPPRIADATIYADVRERVVTFPAVDTGSVMELVYTRTTKATPDSPLGGEELLGAWNPVIERTVTITTPERIKPAFAVEGQTLVPTETSSRKATRSLLPGPPARPGTHTYTFSVHDLPDRHPEMGSLPEAAVLPRLVYGFQPSWQKVLEGVAARFLDKAVPAQMPAAIKDEADRITAGATNDQEKATKLYAFVAHDVRSIDLPLGWAGYEPHAPDVVLQNRYGDDRDKVGLFLALAASQGIKGRPVLVRTGKVPVIASVPTVAQFDRMIAKLDLDGKDVWVDPSDENGQYGIAFAGQDNLVLPLDKAGRELGGRPALDPSTSISTTKATFSLSSSGDLQASYTYDLTGAYAVRASDELRSLKGELLDKHFQQSAAGVAASAIDTGHTVSDTLSVTGPIHVTHDVTVPGYSQTQNGFRVFELPPVSLAVASDEPSANLSTRKSALFLGMPRIERGELSVEIPAGWKVAYVPPSLEGGADGLTYSSSCAAEKQTVSCKSEIKLDKLTVSPEQYPAFREAMTKLQAYERRVVLLTR